ncbi:hypothetical protein E2C01_041329 [Portunus trituberculatus]|uniref:MADF domain-containing protein n=1 Tax=Portunus trituberculatus TaxID=210409 RepID=A0A5B7FIZ3_PORTR|nr:hypothetical protein [Portunus trituberculatus]
MTPEAISKNIRFIKEVEKQPCLYDYTLEQYTNRACVEAAWRAVAAEFSSTIPACKEKWRNLRTVFVRRLKHNPPNGSRANKPYYLMHALEFLLPFLRGQSDIKSTDTQKNLAFQAVKCKIEDNEIKIEENDDFDVEYDDDTDVAAVDDNEAERSETSSEHHEESNEFRYPIIASTTTLAPNTVTIHNDTPSSTGMTHNNKRRAFKTSFNDGSEVLAKNARTSTNYSNGDDCDGRGDGDESRKLFLLSLLGDVRAMTDAQMRKFRRLVLDAIDIVLDETPNETPGHT